MVALASSLLRAQPARGLEELDAFTLARAQKGDRAARERLIRAYQDRVYAVVARMLPGHRRADVDDVAQEAFVKILRGVERFDAGGLARSESRGTRDERAPSGGPRRGPSGPALLSTWVVTVATRTAIDALRRARSPLFSARDGGELDVLPASGAASPEAAATDREIGRRVEAALATLPADQRAVIVLRAYHDLDYPEIASALGVEEGTVKSRLNRARAALRRAVFGDAP